MKNILFILSLFLVFSYSPLSFALVGDDYSEEVVEEAQPVEEEDDENGDLPLTLDR